jgi:hypothetical protein
VYSLVGVNELQAVRKLPEEVESHTDHRVSSIDALIPFVQQPNTRLAGEVKKMIECSLAPLLRAFAAAAVVVATAAAPCSGALADEADAKALLRAMSDYLASQERISFAYDATLELVTDEGQRLGLAVSGTVSLDRPDRMRATRSGGFVDLEVLFDGKTLTILGKKANLYTQVEIPGTIDHLIDEMRDTYGRPITAGDLLMSAPYDELMTEVTDVKDLGSGVIGGQECDWLAFRTPDVDWQIWIAQGERPLPCRYVVVSKGLAHEPEFILEVRDWRTGDAVATDDFEFRNSTGATIIALEDLQEKVREFPQHFTMEDRQ